MNCEEVAHVVDLTELNALSGVERAKVEQHVFSCRRCAAVWSMHSALARSTVPPMPAELAVRCRTVWALPSRASTRGEAGRRLTLIGSVMALAAAAGILGLWMSKEPVPEAAALSTASPVLTSPVEESRPPAAVANVATLVQVNPEPAARHEAAPKPQTLPLLPRPASDGGARIKNAFDKALELYPELVEGPVRDGQFVVGLILLQDGTVLDSVLRHATEDTLPEVSAEMNKYLPEDAQGMSVMTRTRTTPLPDGRVLRADLTLLAGFVSDAYDMARSNARVLSIVGDKYADLMRPATSEEFNRVVLFLSDDGAIQRELVQRISKDAANARATGTGDLAAMTRSIAELFATQVKVDPDQIGMMGNTVLQRGGDAERQILFVRYAWQRRSGEPGPSLGQRISSRPPKVDSAKALIVVKHVLPDAFTLRDPAVGTPTIVLTAKGEVIQAGWVKIETGRSLAEVLKEQLVPGVETTHFGGVTLTDESGTKVEVSLAWESPKQETIR